MSIENSIESLTHLIAMQNIAIMALALAISKQPGIDVKKLTQDVSHALMIHETSTELRPDGISSATSSDYVLLRAMLKKALPDLPIV